MDNSNDQKSGLLKSNQPSLDNINHCTYDLDLMPSYSNRWTNIRFLTSFTAYFFSIVIFTIAYLVHIQKPSNTVSYFIRPLLTSVFSNGSCDQIILYELLFITCYAFHFIRRLYEVFFVHNYQRNAPVMEFFGALIYYSFLAFYNGISTNIYLWNDFGYKCTDVVLFAIGIVVFFIGEFGNAYHHWLLKKMRERRHEKSAAHPNRDEFTVVGHVMPYGGLFEYVSCAHYFFELVSWFGWCLMCAFNVSSDLLFVLSLVTLIGRSKEKHDKYKEEFNGQQGKDLYPPNRKALCPFIF